MTEDIKRLFNEWTGLEAVIVLRISFTEWRVDTEDGDTYYVHQGSDKPIIRGLIARMLNRIIEDGTYTLKYTTKRDAESEAKQ